LVKRSRFSFLVFLSTYVPYHRKTLTFAISFPDEFLSYNHAVVDTLSSSSVLLTVWHSAARCLCVILTKLRYYTTYEWTELSCIGKFHFTWDKSYKCCWVHQSPFVDVFSP